jgi:hypothetical protein
MRLAEEKAKLLGGDLVAGVGFTVENVAVDSRATVGLHKRERVVDEFGQRRSRYPIGSTRIH